MSVTAALHRFATTQPDRTAIRFERDALTWRDLDILVERFAQDIDAHVAKDQGVAICLPNCPAQVILVLAVARSGREAQVLDPQWPREMLVQTLRAVAPGLCYGAKELDLEGTPTWVVDPRQGFDALACAPPRRANGDRLNEPSSDTAFYVGFTSGSTGVPKGYRRTHASWLKSFEADRIEFGITSGDVVLALGPLTHSLFLYALIRGLNAGATVVMCHTFQSGAAIRLIRRAAVTVIYGVPTHYRLLLAAAKRQNTGTIPAVRWVLCSGATWTGADKSQLHTMFPNAELGEFYGASELSFVTLAKSSENVPEHSVGRAFEGVEIAIHRQDGQPAPPYEPGLIFVKSDLVFKGYACGAEGATLRSEDAISVGDIGYLDARRFLYLVGRADRMLVTSGRNVYPEEVEAVLNAHPAIDMSAVIGVTDRGRGQSVIALVSCVHDDAPTWAELGPFMRKRLAPYKMPRQVAALSDWPLTRSGKTDLRAIERLWSSRAYRLLT
jgi:long-chain acyl-CoA synthetase